MNLQTWAKWVAEIRALRNGARVELHPGPYGGMRILVSWLIGERHYAYEHTLSLTEMKQMVESVQPCVLEQITHAVRKMPDGTYGCNALGKCAMPRCPDCPDMGLPE